MLGSHQEFERTVVSLLRVVTVDEALPARYSLEWSLPAAFAINGELGF